MAVAPGCGRFNFDLDQSEDAINVSKENVAVDNHCHAADGEETLASVLVVRQLDIVDNAGDSVL